MHEIAALEQEHGVQVQIDPELLEEVIAITTYPTALYGLFDRTFFGFAHRGYHHLHEGAPTLFCHLQRGHAQ
ncbi:Glycyl-tRNA synthetase beta chain [Helicobacter bizzozeronii CCUG 35545]|nr:Glycyl-tRNA synthetase beta chain [Helicobacter bizzozeronii CCUG 35545]